MNSTLLRVAGLGLLVVAGCTPQERPGGYSRENPDLSARDPRESGLGSKDLVAATDQMAMDLLNDPELNRSRTQWTVVVMKMENQTVTDRRFDYSIFLGALETKISKQGRGRVTLFENLDRFNKMRDEELEGPGRDPFGQGGGAARPARPRQPDYGMYGKVQELPGRGVSTYRLEFTITSFQTGVKVWTNDYIVKLDR
jgi:hypothetical protein